MALINIVVNRCFPVTSKLINHTQTVSAETRNNNIEMLQPATSIPIQKNTLIHIQQGDPGQAALCTSSSPKDIISNNENQRRLVSL